MNAAVKGVLSFFGSGYSPFAPGTAASGVAILACSCIFYACPPLWAWALSGVVAAAFAVATVAWGARAEEHTGARDPGWVVSDEVAGQFVTAMGAAIGNSPGWELWALAFVAFRVLDVAKPFPIGRLEALPRGWGILADDLAAGAVAGALVNGVVRIGLVP